LQHKIIRSIDDADIEKTPMTKRVVAIGILEDKKRLIRNQTTERIDITVVTASIAELQKQAAELRKSL